MTKIDVYDGFAVGDTVRFTNFGRPTVGTVVGFYEFPTTKVSAFIEADGVTLLLDLPELTREVLI